MAGGSAVCQRWPHLHAQGGPSDEQPCRKPRGVDRAPWRAHRAEARRDRDPVCRARRSQRQGRRAPARPRHRPRSAGRDHAAQRAAVRDRVLRRAPGRRCRRADEPVAQVARGGVLSVRFRGRAAVRLARIRRRGAGRSQGRGCRGDRGDARPVRAAAGFRGAAARSGRGGGRGHGRDPVHVGDHRQAEGGRADSPQSCPKRGGGGRSARARGRVCRPRRAAAVPRVRADVRVECRRRCRRDALADRAL